MRTKGLGLGILLGGSLAGLITRDVVFILSTGLIGLGLILFDSAEEKEDDG